MHDLIVVGGGPAGLATALHAVRAGMRVAVIEPRRPPIDKACGEGLMPAALAQLDDLDVHPSGQPFVGIRYLTADGRAAVAETAFRSGSGLGVLRTELHGVLHRAACAAGIDLHVGTVDTIDVDDTSVRAAGLRARYLVGADGLHSRVRRLAGLQAPGPARASRRWGLRAHVQIVPWTDHVEVYWSPIGEAYVTPLAPDLVGVATLSSHRCSFADQLAQLPALAGRLAGSSLLGVRGAGPLRQHANSRVAGRVLLVGDAAGYIDALTGEGLTIAFASAAALVARIAADDPSGYERDYRRISADYRRLTTALLWTAQRPVLRPRLVPAAQRAPWLFSAAVNRLAGTRHA